MNSSTCGKADHPTSTLIEIPHQYEKLVSQTLEGCFRVHRELGPGMLEGAYQACLEWELRQMGLGVDRQIPVDVIYRGHRMETGFRADLLVQDDEGRRVIVELKAVAQMVPIFRAQVITYLRLLDLPLGLLVNFNTVLLKDGISRILNKNWVPPLAGSGIHNHGATDAT